MKRGWVWAGAPIAAARFELRRRLGALRRPRDGDLPLLTPQSKQGLFRYLGDPAAIAEAVAREGELCTAFGLGEMRERCSRRDYRETLDLLDALEATSAQIRTTLTDAPGALRVVDVGARNWSYVGALERFFARLPHGLAELIGVEVDGNGRYADGYRRADYARAYAAAAARVGDSQVRYDVSDFRSWNGLDSGELADCVTMLFPFVLRYPLLAWGMPLYMFDPLEMLRCAVAAIRPKTGLLISMHQTSAERDVMLGHIEALGGQLEVLVTRRHSSRLVAHWHATQDRQIVVARRNW